MLVSPNPPLQSVQPSSVPMLDPADPIWRHVKTEWDHQFVKRANFIPWLRAQLQVDPIDETAPAPEPLLNYVKRRLALAQHQQRLRETVNDGQATVASSASSPLVQGSPGANSSLAPPGADSNLNRTYLEANPASSIAAQNSYPAHSSNFVSSQTSQPPDRARLVLSTGGHLYDHGTSNSPSVSNSQFLAQASAPSSSLSYSSKPLPPSTNTFSSQLGAIADAHMGNSSSMMSASCLTPTPQTNGFHCDPDDSRNTTQYFQSEAQAQQYQQAHLLLMRQEQEQFNRIQQHQRQQVSTSPQHSTHLSSFPTSLSSSSYVDHSAQPNSTLAFPLSHSHPLQPQNVNQYMQTIQSSNIAPYQQYVESQKKNLRHQENAFTHSSEALEFGANSVTEPNQWNPDPLVQIDPTLMTGYGTAYGLRLPIDNPSLPPISPAVDVAPRVTTAAPSDIPSPRRTRSAAALIRKNTAANTISLAPVVDKSSSAPQADGRSGVASASATPAEGSSAPTSTDLSDHNSPPNKTTHQKEKVGSPAPSPSNIPTDHYNRKAWKSRLSTVRAELDHILKAPARSASKLVKILSLYSVSPIPSSGDWSTVPPDGRIEVLSAIKANASQEFYNTWVSESKGLAMLEAWLKGVVHLQERVKPKETSGGGTTDDEAARRETLLINLLQILAKFSLTVDNLKNHTFAKQVIRINKEQNANKFSDDVKRLSIGLEQKWRAVVRGAAGPTPKNGGHDVTSNPGVAVLDNKKRSETASESNNNKKRKVESIKIPIAATPSTSKSTSDLFGRPDKAKLPAFTKKVVEPSPAPAVVQDTFAEAMGLIKGKSTTTGSTDTALSNSASSGKTPGKPSKRVRFAADAELCQIKIVERLVYEGEEYETHPVGDARKMDAVEGRYLHLSDNFLEEEIEWETPIEVLLTPETVTNLETSPLVSPEAEAQEARERSLAEITYEDESQIPDTPNEPSSPETCDADVAESSGLPKTMKLSSDLMKDPGVSRMIAKAQADNSVDAPVAPDHTVSDLLARLGGVGVACSEPPHQQASSAFNLPVGFDINLLNSISQSGSLQALLAASSHMAPPTQQPIPTPQAASEQFLPTSRDNPFPITSGENPYTTTSRENSFPPTGRDNGWGAAAGSAARGREAKDSPAPYIPTGPSAGVSRHKRRRKGKDGVQPRISAHDSFGRHIKCKWWPNCPHGHKCFYKHG